MSDCPELLDLLPDASWGGRFPDLHVILLIGTTLGEVRQNVKIGPGMRIEEIKDRGLSNTAPAT